MSPAILGDLLQQQSGSGPKRIIHTYPDNLRIVSIGWDGLKPYILSEGYRVSQITEDKLSQVQDPRR